jgi:hypothetical protein
MPRSLFGFAMVIISLPAAAAAVPGPQILVVQAKKTVLPEPFDQVSLAAEVKKDLYARGFPIAGACTEGDCGALARELGATDLLTIEAEYLRDRYSCSVRVEIRSLTGELKFGSSYGGDSCPAADLVDHTKQVAANVSQQLMSQSARQATSSAVPIDKPPEDAGAGGRTLTGAGILAGGAVTAGFGAYLWYLDGRCAHSGMVAGETRCGDRYDTRTLGIPLTLVGAAAMGFGTWMLWQAHDTSVALGPDRIVVVGRFQ